MREELLQAERYEIDSYLTPLARALEREGALTLRFCESGFCMTIEAGPDTVRRLALMPEILRLDKGTGGTHENASITGQTVSFGAQMEQFQDLNYMGDYNWLSRGVIDVAVVEHNILRKSHPGFKESTTSTSRVQKTMDCTEQSGCLTSNHTSGYHFHPVAVAGLALGDLTDGQDPLYTSEYSRESRSGYGREANLLFYRAIEDENIPTALDYIASEPAELLSMSISSFVNANPSANPPVAEIDTDPDCLGQHPNALGVNTLFENGILTFVATGNNGHGNTSDCGVEDAANAIGAFAVSLYTSNWDVSDPIGEVRNGPLHTKSDRGGTWDSSGNILEGSGRTIIDLVAQGCRTMIFDEFGGYTEQECATSYAAPTAAGAAVQVMDHYRNNYSDLIYEPGMLAVNMLLMGDRETESGVKASSGFDSVWGAGRMKMRKWDTYGLDEPFEYSDFLTCISDGQNYIVWINQGLDIGTDVDVIKGVLYFYDHRHGGGNAIDNIDLILQKYTYNPFTMRWSWNTIVSSDSPTDEKERVYYEPNGGKYRFLIRGTDVSAIDEGCDAGSMMVYFAYYMEDSDRDDANGPDWTIDEEDTP